MPPRNVLALIAVLTLCTAVHSICASPDDCNGRQCCTLCCVVAGGSCSGTTCLPPPTPQPTPSGSSSRSPSASASVSPPNSLSASASASASASPTSPTSTESPSTTESMSQTPSESASPSPSASPSATPSPTSTSSMSPSPVPPSLSASSSASLAPRDANCTQPPPLPNATCLDGEWVVYINGTVVIGGQIPSNVTVNANVSVPTNSSVTLERGTRVVVIGSVDVRGRVVFGPGSGLSGTNGTLFSNSSEVCIDVSDRAALDDNSGTFIPLVSGSPVVDEGAALCLLGAAQLLDRECEALDSSLVQRGSDFGALLSVDSSACSKRASKFKFWYALVPALVLAFVLTVAAIVAGLAVSRSSRLHRLLFRWESKEDSMLRRDLS